MTFIDEKVYINYTSVSKYGATTSLVVADKNMSNWEKKGVVFLAENKDVAIFPERINGKYYAYSRPVPNAIGSPDI